MAKTPIFAFRLAKPDRERVEEMARLYGSPNASVFAREMVTAICSGDQARVYAFQLRLSEKLTGQLQLEFQQKRDAELKELRQELQQQVAKPRKPAKRGKGAKRDKRAT